MVGYQLEDSKSLYRKWLEITISIQFKLVVWGSREKPKIRISFKLRLRKLGLATGTPSMIMVFDRGTYEVVKSFLQDYWGSEYKRWIKKDGKKDVYIYIYIHILHPRQLTWHWKIHVLNRKYIFKWLVFGGVPRTSQMTFFQQYSTLQSQQWHLSGL